MRSFVFLLMLAVCLVSWKCAAATGEDENSHQTTDQLEAVGSVDTTKAAEQPQPQPQPQARSENVGAPKDSAPHNDPEVADDLDNPDAPKGSEGPKPDNASLTRLPADPFHPEKPLEAQHQPQQQQLQQQPQLSQHITPQGSVPTDEVPGSVSHNQNHAPPTRTSEDELHIAVVDTQTRTPDAHSGQPEHQVPERRLEPQRSPSSHSTAEVVKNTEDTQPKKGQKTDYGPPGKSQPHAPPPTPPTLKSTTPVNDATTSVAGPATAEKQQVPPKKPITNFTPTTDNAVNQTDTLTEDNETHAEQTSVTSTAQPAKKESTKPANTSQKITKAMQSLENKDSSIGTSSIFAFAVLPMLFMLAGTLAF